MLSSLVPSVEAIHAAFEPHPEWDRSHPYRCDFGAQNPGELCDPYIIESWRRHYNTVRPHSSLDFRPPAPEVELPAFAARPAVPRSPAPRTTQTVAPRPMLH